MLNDHTGLVSGIQGTDGRPRQVQVATMATLEAGVILQRGKGQRDGARYDVSSSGPGVGAARVGRWGIARAARDGLHAAGGAARANGRGGADPTGARPGEADQRTVYQ